MGIKEVYRRSSGEVVTYDFFDLADGSGIVTLYGAVDSRGRGVLSGGYLTRNTPYSDTIVTNSSTSSTNYAKEFDKSFDLYINKPITIKGNATFNIPLACGQGATGPSSGGCYPIVGFGKISNGVYTEVVSGTALASTWTSSGGTSKPNIFYVRLNVPLTNYAIGDTLRVKVEGWAKSSYSDGECSLGHDPKNRDGSSTASAFASTDPTQMTFYVPILVDL